MSETRFAPGPYKVVPWGYHDGGRRSFFIESESEPGRAVAFMGNGPEEYDRANAHLLAAAPELYGQLAALVLHCFDEEDMRSEDHLYYVCRECQSEAEDDHLAVVHEADCSVASAVAALKKARGEA